MKVKVVLYTIFILMLIVIQTTLLNYIRVFNVKPNLLIIFITSVALLRGNVEGAVVGFFTGLSQDIATGKIIGFYSLLGMFLGLVVGSVNRRLYRENFLLIMFFSFTATLVYESLVYLFALFMRGQMDLYYAFRQIILPEAIYNCILSVVMFILVIWMHYKIEDAAKITRKY